MAYSKIRLEPKKLEEEALKLIDFRIDETNRRISELSDQAKLAENRSAWREAFLSRVEDFLAKSRVEDLADGELVEFLNQFTYNNSYPREEKSLINQYQRSLRGLELEKKRVSAIVASLHREADGTVTLTKPQMRNVFGL